MDLEIALTDLKSADCPSIAERVGAKYEVLDRTNKRWGIVIRPEEFDDDVVLDDAIKATLNGLQKIRDRIRSADAILRIGIYSQSATTTINVACAELLADFELKLEISIYPV